MSGYTVLVVDPPWSYGSATGRTRTAEHHYETLGNAGKEINRKSGPKASPARGVPPCDGGKTE